MTHNRILIFAATVAVLLGCGGGAAVAQQTQKFTAAKHNDYGLTYSLPVTYLRIEVELEKTVSKAGPYYEYAQRYLGVNNPIEEDSQQWTLKSAKITTYGVPDPEQRYLVEFKGGNSVSMILSEDGLPLAINREVPPSEVPQRKKPRTDNSTLTAEDLVMALPGELLVSESTAKRAQIAAQRIYTIRDSRTAFATGEADQMPDGEALKLIMQQLDDQERALMALFVGRQQTEVITRTFDYYPTDAVDREVLFRLSDANGPVKADDLGGDPIYISLEITQQGEVPIDEKTGEPRKLPKNALMYNVPGRAQVTLRYGGHDIASSEVNVAQFGIQFGLDPGLFSSKKSPYGLLFYPESGSIKDLAPIQKND